MKACVLIVLRQLQSNDSETKKADEEVTVEKNDGEINDQTVTTTQDDDKGKVCFYFHSFESSCGI